MSANEFDKRRRRAVVAGCQWLLASTAGLGLPQTSLAGKAAKADFSYQDKPKDGKTCASCKLFAPADAGRGSCAVVDGEISPTGWCMAYSPRQ